MVYIFNNLNKFKKVLKEEYKNKWNNLNEFYISRYNTFDREVFSLPTDFVIDDCQNYKEVNCPLSFFFRNSYLYKKNEWFPIDINNPHKPLFELKNLNITLGDYYKLCSFVDKHKKKLVEIANRKYNLDVFKKNFKEKLFEQQINEMANISPEYTGLKHDLWFDLGETYKKGGHWLRLKIKTNDGTSTLTIPSLEWVGGENIKEFDKKIIEKYVRINIDKLVSVLTNKISLEDYKAYSTKVDAKGLPISVLDIKKWNLYGELEKNIKIYKRNNLPIKYLITNDNKTSLFKDENGNNILFDNIIINQNNKKLCFGYVNNVEYILTCTGKMINSENFL